MGIKKPQRLISEYRGNANMSGKYDLDRDLYIRKLRELREPGRPLCKHDWVGDDDCVYCRNEQLEAELALWDGREEVLCNLIDERDAEIGRLRTKYEELIDEYQNGIQYDDVNNQYILVWTEKQITDAKREANKIYSYFKGLDQTKEEP